MSSPSCDYGSWFSWLWVGDPAWLPTLERSAHIMCEGHQLAICNVLGRVKVILGCCKSARLDSLKHPGPILFAQLHNQPVMTYANVVGDQVMGNYLGIWHFCDNYFESRLVLPTRLAKLGESRVLSPVSGDRRLQTPFGQGFENHPSWYPSRDQQSESDPRH